MKLFFNVLIVLISSSFARANDDETYLVIANNGLFLREEPRRNAAEIGKLSFGIHVIIKERSGKRQTITDGGKRIEGEWVRVEYQNFPIFVSNQKSGYVFSGYLKKRAIIETKIMKKMAHFSELEGYSIHSDRSPFYFEGDFFGDGIKDLVVLVKDKENITKVTFLNYGKKHEVLFLGGENDPFKIVDYEWAEVFLKIMPGEPLWSNYDTCFINYEDVPEHRKVRLSYNSLYMHYAESCGGGFIYWKNGRFNWLQQE